MPIQYEEGPRPDEGLYGGLGSILGLLGGGALGLGLGYMSGEPTNKTSEEYVKAGLMTPEQKRVYDSIKNEAEKNAYRKEVFKENEYKRGAGTLNNITGKTTESAPNVNDTMKNLGGPQSNQMPPTSQMNQPKSIEQMRHELLNSGLPPHYMNLGAKIISDTEKQQAREKEISSRERTDAIKSTAKYRAELAKETESSSNILDVINEQEKLSATGKMNDPAWLSFLEKVGLDIGALKSPESAAFQALEKEYLRDLKPIFGGRISNQEMQAFLRGIPKATDTPEGRKLISQRLKALYKAKLLKFKTSQQIIKDNGGYPPWNLQELVTEKTIDKEKQYANQFLGIPKGAELVMNKKTGQRGYKTSDGKIHELEEL